MKLTFLGAAGEVTGSGYLVQTSQARILIDFGQHQGEQTSDELNRAPFPVDAKSLDAVVLTHAHIDHIGLLPRLPAMGFSGPIFATPATVDLCPIMLKDAARIQEADAFRAARKAERTGAEPPPLLFTEADVARTLPMLKPMGMREWTQVAPGISVRPVEAGHIIGSASLELRVTEGTRTKRIVFSGDIGPTSVPLIPDPQPPTEADVVVMESTYGNRDHRPLSETLIEAERILHEAIWSKQRVFIPAFAIGRTQLVLYYLNQLAETGRVPRFPIYLDSPMATEAMRVYLKNLDSLDEASQEIVGQSRKFFDIPGLRCTESAEDSKRINNLEGAAVVIAGSGMCNGGRILHHLKHNLWKRDSHVIIVGYQSHGTLGRRLVEGADRVRIFGDEVVVRAKIHTLGGLSAHAGQSELVKWADRIKTLDGTGRPRFILTHGEDQAREAMSAKLSQTLGITSELPKYMASVEI